MTPPLQLAGTLSGSPLTLETLRGQPTLLLFWNIGCAGCTGRALPLTLTLAERYPDLQLVAIHSVFPPRSEQPVREVSLVAKHFALPYEVALDAGDATYRAFGAEGTPHWVLLDRDGHVWRSFFGSMAGSQQRLSYALQELFERPERRN